MWRGCSLTIQDSCNWQGITTFQVSYMFTFFYRRLKKFFLDQPEFQLLHGAGPFLQRSVLFDLLLSTFYLWWLLLCKQVMPVLNGTLGHFSYWVWLKLDQGAGLQCLAGGCTTLLWCAHPPFRITLSLYCLLSSKVSVSSLTHHIWFF